MNFLYRLRACWLVLRARRFALFVPAYPNMHLAVGGTVPTHAWEAIVHFAMREHAQAVEAAHLRLEAAIATDEASAERLLAEARALLAGPH